MPQVRFSTVRDFFAALEATDPVLPDWDGELYMEGHRGVLTTQGWIKRANRKAEIALHNAEAARVMAGQRGMPSELSRAWELLCLNQFHDILAGTSIGEVFDDARRDFCEIDRLVSGVTGESLERLGSRVADGSRWLIANLSPCTQTALVELDETERSAGPLKDLVTGESPCNPGNRDRRAGRVVRRTALFMHLHWSWRVQSGLPNRLIHRTGWRRTCP